jgi:hypothetical protein
MLINIVFKSSKTKILYDYVSKIKNFSNVKLWRGFNGYRWARNSKITSKIRLFQTSNHSSRPPYAFYGLHGLLSCVYRIVSFRFLAVEIFKSSDDSNGVRIDEWTVNADEQSVVLWLQAVRFLSGQRLVRSC